MGKGQIISGGTDGLYQVKLMHDRVKAERSLARINGWITRKEEQIAALPVGDPEHKLPQLKLELASLQKQKDYLERIPQDPEVSAWCADFSENLSNDVGTIEINGDTQKVLIRPGHSDNAEHDADRDGQLQYGMAMTPEQWFYNAAMTPGWKKWMPTYRIGTILQKTDDICNVSLDAADTEIANASNRNINEAETLSSVPIEYMECNGMAFEVGDRVVVEFSGQDFDSPKVIGFEDHPKECSEEFAVIRIDGKYLIWDIRKNAMAEVPTNDNGVISGIIDSLGDVSNWMSKLTSGFQWYMNRTDNDLEMCSASPINFRDMGVKKGWFIYPAAKDNNRPEGYPEYFVSITQVSGSVLKIDRPVDSSIPNNVLYHVTPSVPIYILSEFAHLKKYDDDGEEIVNEIENEFSRTECGNAYLIMSGPDGICECTYGISVELAAGGYNYPKASYYGDTIIHNKYDNQKWTKIKYNIEYSQELNIEHDADIDYNSDRYNGHFTSKDYEGASCTGGPWSGVDFTHGFILPDNNNVSNAIGPLYYHFLRVNGGTNANQEGYSDYFYIDMTEEEDSFLGFVRDTGNLWNGCTQGNCIPGAYDRNTSSENRYTDINTTITYNPSGVHTPFGMMPGSNRECIYEEIAYMRPDVWFRETLSRSYTNTPDGFILPKVSWRDLSNSNKRPSDLPICRTSFFTNKTFFQLYSDKHNYGTEADIVKSDVVAQSVFVESGTMNIDPLQYGRNSGLESAIGKAHITDATIYVLK